LTDYSLYLVTDTAMCQPRGLVETVREAVSGGVSIVQLRDKTAPEEEFIRTAKALKAVLDPAGVPLILNDRVELASACSADGVHVGQGDMPAEEARAMIGPDRILGLSIENILQMQELDPRVVDYAGVGPIFATQTKRDAAPPLGFHGLEQITKASPVPVVAIGGLKANHVNETLTAGVAGLAVVSEICAASNPRKTAEDLRQRILSQRSKDKDAAKW
jgi:thiamine-phosphate pyrophosphorylase